MNTPAPGPSIRVFGVRTRPDRKKPFTVRWSCNGTKHESTPAMTTRKAAERWMARLVLAEEAGAAVKWDETTGLPRNWADESGIDVDTWCRRWLRQEWDGLAPKSRLSIALTLVFIIERSAPDTAPALTVEQRRELRDSFAPRAPALPPKLCAWVKKWSPSLISFDGPMLTRLDKRMRQRVDGSGPSGSNTARRQSNTARQCLDAAVRAHILTENAWPKPVKGANRRKKSRRDSRGKYGTKRVIITPSSARAVLDHLPNRQKESWRYRCMSLIGFFIGTRPSECATLEVEDFTFTGTGWGKLQSVRA